jgi:hypothetical protein
MKLRTLLLAALTYIALGSLVVTAQFYFALHKSSWAKVDHAHLSTGALGMYLLGIKFLILPVVAHCLSMAAFKKQLSSLPLLYNLAIAAASGTIMVIYHQHMLRYLPFADSLKNGHLIVLLYMACAFAISSTLHCAVYVVRACMKPKQAT